MPRKAKPKTQWLNVEFSKELIKQLNKLHDASHPFLLTRVEEEVLSETFETMFLGRFKNASQVTFLAEVGGLKYGITFKGETWSMAIFIAYQWLLTDAKGDFATYCQAFQSEEDAEEITNFW